MHAYPKNKEWIAEPITMGGWVIPLPAPNQSGLPSSFLHTDTNTTMQYFHVLLHYLCLSCLYFKWPVEYCVASACM